MVTITSTPSAIPSSFPRSRGYIYAATHPGCSRHEKELASLVAELPADAGISLDRTSRLVAGLVRADLTRGKMRRAAHLG